MARDEFLTVPVLPDENSASVVPPCHCFNISFNRDYRQRSLKIVAADFVLQVCVFPVSFLPGRPLAIGERVFHTDGYLIADMLQQFRIFREMSPPLNSPRSNPKGRHGRPMARQADLRPSRESVGHIGNRMFMSLEVIKTASAWSELVPAVIPPAAQTDPRSACPC